MYFIDHTLINNKNYKIELIRKLNENLFFLFNSFDCNFIDLKQKYKLLKITNESLIYQDLYYESLLYFSNILEKILVNHLNKKALFTNKIKKNINFILSHIELIL